MVQPCRSCKQPVDSSADKCPHCGTTEPSKGAIIRTVIGGIVTAAAAVWVMSVITCGGHCI